MEKPHRVALKLAVGMGDSRLILHLRNFFLAGTLQADLESGNAAPEALEEVFGEVGKWNVEIARKFLLRNTHFFSNQQSFTKVKTIKETRCSQVFYCYFF